MNVLVHTPARTIGTITATTRAAASPSRSATTAPASRRTNCRTSSSASTAPESRGARGSGLGLAIAAEIAAAHGGTAEAARACPHGLRIRLSLPGYASPRRIRTAATPSRTARRRRTRRTRSTGASDVAGSGWTVGHGLAGRAGQVLAHLVGQAPGQEADQRSGARTAGRTAPRSRPPCCAAGRPGPGRAARPPPGTARCRSPRGPRRAAPSDTDRCWRPRIDCPARKTATAAGTLTAMTARGQHGRLAPQRGQPPRHRRQRGPDQPGGVLAGDQQHAEHPDGDLRELHPGQADRGRVERGDAAAPCGGLATRSRLYRMPNATTRITADSSDHSAAGWVRSLVHSDFITRAWVTRCGCGRTAGPGAAAGGAWW